MDKETLSNYGWIVICVLVLAVMIALATPFGTFVSEAVQSTTKGLFDVNKSALDSTGLITIDNQEFDVPDMNHGAENNGGTGETTVYYGDVDMDGDVDTDDANLVKAYTLGNCTLSEEQIDRADVDGNGEVAVNDSTIIRAYIAGNITTFPVEQ